LDITRDGSVKLEDIAKTYNVDSHPDIISGAKSPE